MPKSPSGSRQTAWFSSNNGRIADIAETADFTAFLASLGIKRVEEAGPEGNQPAVRCIIEEVWNRTKLDAIPRLFAQDSGRHGHVLSHAGVKPILTKQGTERPDLHYTIEDMVAEGDWVVIRRTASGTYTGSPIEHPLFGRVTPAARMRVTVSGINIFRVVDGKVVETWEYSDLASLAKQVGVTFTTGQGPA